MGANAKKSAAAAVRVKPGARPTRQASRDAVMKEIRKARGKATTTAIAKTLGEKDVRAVGNAIRALRREGKVIKNGGARGNTATYAPAPQAA